MWSRSISVSTAISLYNNSDTRLAKQLRASSYSRPRRAKFRNTSKKKIGRQALENRLMHLNNVDFDWIGPKVSKNYIKVKLKKQFFHL